MTPKPETKESVERKGFEIPEGFLHSLSLLPHKDKKAVEEIKRRCKEVEGYVDRLGLSNKHSAVITDGNLAVSWMDDWSNNHQATKPVSYFLVT